MGKTNVEYADEQITVYPAPCPFKCRYCWSQDPLWVHRTRNANPMREAWKLANARKSRRIVVSFTTDPYQPIEEEKKLTRETLSLLLNSKVSHEIYILTKNPELAFKRDWDLMQYSNVWLGSTITSHEPISDEMLAPSNQQRTMWLKNAHDEGVKTWASLEPWLPEKTFPRQIIEATHAFVDWYVIGRLNYETRYGYPKTPKDYYKEETYKIIDLFMNLGYSPSQFPRRKGYLVKKELRANP